MSLKNWPKKFYLSTWIESNTFSKLNIYEQKLPRKMFKATVYDTFFSQIHQFFILKEPFYYLVLDTKREVLSVNSDAYCH